MPRKSFSPFTLSRTANYALRAMSVLAELEPDQHARASELAETVQAPQHYLSKVMRMLVLAELVKANKGHGGGFRLSRAPGEIRLSDVLDACQFDLEHQECVFGWPECADEKPCPLHPAWKELRGTLVNWAAARTLADLEPSDSIDA